MPLLSLKGQMIDSTCLCSFVVLCLGFSVAEERLFGWQQLGRVKQATKGERTMEGHPQAGSRDGGVDGGNDREVINNNATSPFSPSRMSVVVEWSSKSPFLFVFDVSCTGGNFELTVGCAETNAWTQSRC